jgi:hypothetical protein
MVCSLVGVVVVVNFPPAGHPCAKHTYIYFYTTTTTTTTTTISTNETWTDMDMVVGTTSVVTFNK